MRLKNLDLIIIMLIVVINLGWVLLPDQTPFLSIILVLPLIFYLPGYALTAFLFYQQTLDAPGHLIRKPKLEIERPFNISDRFILSLGLSVTIDIICGFILNMLPIGLQRTSWVVALALITAVFSLFTLFRRRKLRITAKRSISTKFQISFVDYILILLALTIAALTIIFSISYTNRQPQNNFTQMWILPMNQSNNGCGVFIGIHSFEYNSQTYRAIMTINNTQTKEWSSIVLAPQQEWDKQVLLTPGSSIYVDVQLYRVDEPKAVYRDVHLTLYGVKKGENGQNQHCAI